MSGTVAKHDVFFSYNWRDRGAVEAVARALREQGLTVFLDRWYLVPGRPWARALEEALNNCQAVSVFLGPHGMGRWQQREKELALDRQARDAAFPVVPVLLPGAEPALGFLSLNTWVDMRAGIGDPRPMAVMAAAVRGQPPGPELQEQVRATVATVCPYRGLRPFREEDAPLFFGREAFTSRLAEAIGKHRMIAVVGASGSGKSSVARAGLVPHVRKGVGKQVWDAATLFPGERPLHALAAALVPLLEPEMTETDRLAEIGKLARHFAEKHVALGDVVVRALEKQPGTDHLLLIIDQWEELYTLVRDDRVRQSFMDELLAATDGGTLTAVLTLRGDFFGRVLSYRPLADRLQDAVVNLGPMTREELERAIESPAEKVGLAFESGLVGRILDDVGEEPGNLPLLEFVLTGLWERRRAGMLLHEAYEDMGEVRGAMAHRADEVFGELSPAEQRVVRQVLIQLVSPGEGTEDTRRRATFTEVGQAARPVVQKLAKARLTVTGRDEATGEETVEVAHEALIHNWARLRGWLDEDREFLLWRQRLRAHLEEWERTGREKGTLLRGAPLTEAERWLIERAGDISPAEHDFVKQSVACRQAEQAARERLRNRIATGLIAGLLVALVLAVLAGWQWLLAKKQSQIASEQTHVALDQKNVALARGLAAQSELTMSQRANLRQRGLLLAVESMRRFPSFEGDQAIRHGLAMLPRHVAAMRREDSVLSVAFSPDGKYLATASPDNTAWVWEAIMGKQAGQTSSDYWWWAVEGEYLTFSPDGKYLATISAGTARVWEVTSGEQIARMNREDWVHAVAFSPDGKYLATVSSDKTIQLLGATSGKEVARMNHENDVRFVAFGPDGKYLATASSDQTARVWEATTGEQIARMNHDDAVQSVAFSPDGKYLATASHDKTARVWEATSGKEVALMNHEYGVFFVTFSPDGKYLATASGSMTRGNVRMWEATTGKEVAHMNHEVDVTSVAFSADGKYLVTVSYPTVQVWEVTSGKEVMCINHEAPVSSVTFSPDGKYVATVSEDYYPPRVWEATSGKEVMCVNHEAPVTSVAFSPDGKYLATASYDKTARVWGVTSGKEVALLNHEETVSSVAFSPDGKYLATASNDETARLWEAISGQEVARMKHDDPVHFVAFSPNGKYLATASGSIRRGTARVWGVTDSKEVARMDHEIEVSSVAFSPDGMHLATASQDKTARVWEVTRGKEVARMNHDGWVHSVAFSPDGKYLATACLDKTGGVWDATTGEKITHMNHEEGLPSVTFSPDGKYLATASIDNTAGVWDATTGEQIACVNHEGYVSSVAFSPDGKYLATASGDGTARVQLWRPEDLIAEACSRLTRNLTYQEWQRYLPDEPYRKTCPNLPIHPSFIEAGRDLAKTGDIEGALAIFRRAAELTSSLDLNAAEAEMRKVAFEALRDKGLSLAREGKVKGAIAAYEEAENLCPDQEISATYWNELGWYGSLWGYADDVMFACEKVVELEPDNGAGVDTRGLARALTGNIPGAIEDFEFYIEWARDERPQQEIEKRRDWIRELKAGRNPFDEATLEALRNE